MAAAIAAAKLLGFLKDNKAVGSGRAPATTQKERSCVTIVLSKGGMYTAYLGTSKEPAGRIIMGLGGWHVFDLRGKNPHIASYVVEKLSIAIYVASEVLCQPSGNPIKGSLCPQVLSQKAPPTAAPKN